MQDLKLVVTRNKGFGFRESSILIRCLERVYFKQSDAKSKQKVKKEYYFVLQTQISWKSLFERNQTSSNLEKWVWRSRVISFIFFCWGFSTIFLKFENPKSRSSIEVPCYNRRAMISVIEWKTEAYNYKNILANTEIKRLW